jgi:hypothetical protein
MDILVVGVDVFSTISEKEKYIIVMFIKTLLIGHF